MHEMKKVWNCREDLWVCWLGGLFSKIVRSWCMKSSEEGIKKDNENV